MQSIVKGRCLSGQKGKDLSTHCTLILDSKEQIEFQTKHRVSYKTGLCVIILTEKQQCGSQSTSESG